MPDARRVAPISGSVFVLAFSGSGTFIILQQSYTPSILHLTLTRCNSLIANTLLSVRCYQRHLHTTYTTYTLPAQPTGCHTARSREEDITA